METICRIRLILPNTINICGLYTIDLKAIFVLLSEINLLAIIFIQNTIYMGIERGKEES